MILYGNVKNVILFEEGRFHNDFEVKSAKWPIAPKKKKPPSKYTPTINSFDFARQSGH